VVSKHLSKSRLSGTVAEVGSSTNRSDDMLLQQMMESKVQFFTAKDSLTE
jgi:hypothetical protein